MKKDYLKPYNRVIEVEDGYLGSPSDGENEDLQEGDSFGAARQQRDFEDENYNW